MRVLVTRPEPGASETAARLKTLGHEAVVLPLTEIRPLPVTEMPDLASVDGVALTSANAVRHAPLTLIALLSAKPCYAVGERTATAAREAGFHNVFSADGDAASLARLIQTELQQGASVAYLCGCVRRVEFETALRGLGLPVLAVETYDTPRTEVDDELALRQTGAKPVDAALVYSVTGAEALAGLARRVNVAHLFAETRYLCLSQRIAEALELGAASCVPAGPEPTEATLISLIGAGRAA